MRTVRRNQGRVHAGANVGFSRADAGAATLPPMQGSRAGRITRSLDLTGTLKSLLNRESAIALFLLALGLSAFIPGVDLKIGSHSAGVAMNTATTLILMFAGVLFLGRFSQRRQLRPLLLAVATAMIGLSTICSQVLTANHVQVFAQSGGWVALCGRLIGWFVIAASAIAPNRTLPRVEWRNLLSDWWTAHNASAQMSDVEHDLPDSTSTRHRIGSVRVLALISCAIFSVGLGAYVIASDPTSHAPLSDPSGVLRVRIMIAVFSCVAAIAYLRELRLDGDASVRLLAFAAMIGASSSIAYCATPTMPFTSLRTADVLRLCAIAVLALSVCVGWLVDERRAQARAVAAERHRMAADVHDLIMQDLSLALATARTLGDDPTASFVVEAGERALAGARGVLNRLTDMDQLPIVEAVEEGVRARSRRASLSFDAAGVPADARPDAPTRDALVHIGREAVTNAVKHSHSDSVEVTLAYQDEWHLTIRANGRGFNPESQDQRPRTPSSGFGLASMRRSAENLGGSLHVTSAIGQDTTIEALLP
jgi:signal transduction histidine kinase